MEGMLLQLLVAGVTLLSGLLSLGATGDVDNFKIYHEEAYTGMSETITRNLAAFNAASQGAITLTSMRRRGNFDKNSFVTRMSGLVSRRDNTDSTTNATAIAMAQDENIAVKLNRLYGPVEVTLDAFKKIAPNADAQREASEAYGAQLGDAIMQDWLDSSLRAVEACLDKSTNTEHDASDGTLATSDLVTGLSKAGDQFGQIVAWVMHSKVYFDLLNNQITNAIYRANGTRIVDGVPATLDRPVIVTDSPVLLSAASPDNYVTMGLQRGAVSAVESEERTMVTDIVTGKLNIILRLQGEGAFNVGVKGFKYSSATANPTDANLNNSSNWTQTAASHKATAGVRILSR